MKGKSCTVGAFFLLLLIAACVLIAAWEESSKCGIDPLVLGEEKMPEGWKTEWVVLPPALETLGAKEACGVFLKNNDETAHHTVYRYSNRWLASFHMWFDRETFFPSVGWEWSDLEGAEALPVRADQWQVECGASNYPLLGSRCAAAFRYGPYVSDFSSSIKEGVMSTEEFTETVLRIDELFDSCTE
jgi:hypothetical protein